MHLAPLPPALLPGPDFVDRAWGASERSPAWLRSFQALFDAGRLAGSGHLCLLAGGGAPEALATLAEEGGCSGLVAGERALGAVARRYAHRLPLIASVEAEGEPAAQARRLRDLGAVGVCVTLDAQGPLHDARTAAFTAAATAEGLVVVARYAARERTSSGGAPGLQLGGALGWEAEEARAGEPVAAIRRRVAESGRVGLLVGVDLHGDADTSALAKRAGAMGVVVTAAASGDPTRDVAALHAIQDVWADGRVTLD